MFPLQTDRFPENAADLARLLNESIRQLFSGLSDPVSVEDEAFPHLRQLQISLDGAEMRPNLPRPSVPAGDHTPALRVAALSLTGKRVKAGPATVDLALDARDVVFSHAPDAQGNIVLLLQRAAEGKVEISTAKADLEAAITAVATIEAGKQGVAIEGVRLSVRERGPRSVSAEVEVKAKKLFFSTTIRIVADLDLDEQLNATLSGLACRGDGTIGTLACGVLTPHLQKLDGRTFPLLALPLGEIRLRDIRLLAAERIAVQADFGA